MCKKVCRIMVVLLMAAFMAGCMDAPESVKEDVKNNKEVEGNKNDSKSPSKEIEAKRVPVSEVAKNTPSKWDKTEGSVTFNGIIQVPDVSQLYKWKVEVADGVYKNPEKTKEVFLKYFDNLNVKSSHTAVGEDYESSISFADEEEIADPDGSTDELAMSNVGFLSVWNLTEYWKNPDEGNEWLTVPQAGFPYEKTYFFNLNGECVEGGTDTWKLRGGRTIEVQTAMDDLQKYMRDYKKLESSADMVPDRLSVFSYGDGTYFVSLHDELVYDGVKVDGTSIIEQPIKEYGNLCRLSSNIEQLEYGVGDKLYWTRVEQVYKRSEKLEVYDEILSFEEAWRILTQEAAKEVKVEIQRTDLVYSIWYQPTGDTDEKWFSHMSNQPDMYATPVWRFQSYQNGQTSYVYYVDAVTGEVTAYDHVVLG